MKGDGMVNGYSIQSWDYWRANQYQRIFYSCPGISSLYRTLVQHACRSTKFTFMCVYVCVLGNGMAYIFQQARNIGVHGMGVVVIYQYGGNPLIFPAATTRGTHELIEAVKPPSRPTYPNTLCWLWQTDPSHLQLLVPFTTVNVPTVFLW